MTQQYKILTDQEVKTKYGYIRYPAEPKPPSRSVYWQCYEPRKRRAKIKNAKYA